jgi:hypothetical protein
MPTSYRYVIRSFHGAGKLESELLTLSSQAWEPINLQRDSAGNYEVVLRQEVSEHTEAVVEQADAPAGDPAAPPYRYAVRNMHGNAKLETEMTNLASEGWEPINFQRDANGTYDVVLRQNQHEGAPTTFYRYGARSIHGVGKLESELMNLSSDGWEPLHFQRDAGTYYLILRRLHDGQTDVEPERPEGQVNIAPPYRFAVRHVHGAAKLESELTDLSTESWEPLSFLREPSGTYEIILRQKS